MRLKHNRTTGTHRFVTQMRVVGVESNRLYVVSMCEACISEWPF